MQQKIWVTGFEIIVRKYYLLESSKEIADRLQISVNAVDIRIHRALKKLKSILGGKENEKRQIIGHL